MHAPSPRLRRLATFAVLPVAMLVSAAVVMQSSYAAFSAQTSAGASNWTNGAVALTNDSSATALFSVTNMKPGATGQKCVTVTSNGSLPGTVKLFTTGETASANMDQYLKLTVTAGSGTCGSLTGSSSVVAAGTSLKSLSTASTGYGNGAGSWATAGTTGETKVYQFNWTFDTTSLTQAQVDALQSATVGVGFTWEIQNS